MSDKEIETTQTETPEAQPKKPAVEQTPAAKSFLEWNGRKFNNADEARGFMDALAFAQGSAAQKYGEILKEVEPLRKYNLKKADVDDVSIMKQVEQHRAEGNNAQADALMFEYVRQVKADSDNKLEETRLWNDYVASRKDVFDVLDTDMSKDYVFKNYRDKLQETDSPFELLDSVLKPKASKLKPIAQITTQNTDESTAGAVATVLGSGNGAMAPRTTQTEPDDSASDNNDAWGQLMDEFKVKG